jgi:hypothetical protein
MSVRQQGQVLWWVLVMTLLLSALGVQMLQTSLLQWQWVQRSHTSVQALWLAETHLLELERTAARTEWLEAMPERPLMPELPIMIDAAEWQPYWMQSAANGLRLGYRTVALGPACLDPELPCQRLVFLTVVIFDDQGLRLLALRRQFRLERQEQGSVSLQRLAWEWL